MYTKASVFPRTFQTNPNTIGYTNPLGVVATTFKAILKRESYDFMKFIDKLLFSKCIKNLIDQLVRYLV